MNYTYVTPNATIVLCWHCWLLGIEILRKPNYADPFGQWVVCSLFVGPLSFNVRWSKR
jgi:hypothetical protein